MRASYIFPALAAALYLPFWVRFISRISAAGAFGSQLWA